MLNGVLRFATERGTRFEIAAGVWVLFSIVVLVSAGLWEVAFWIMVVSAVLAGLATWIVLKDQDVGHVWSSTSRERGRCVVCGARYQDWGTGRADLWCKGEQRRERSAS